MKELWEEPLWQAYWGITGAVALVIGILVGIFTQAWVGILVGPVVFLVAGAVSLVRGYAEVPQNSVWLVERFGAYIGNPWTAGLHFLFPWFGFMDAAHEVYLGEQQMRLYMSDDVEEGYGEGHVEFTDGSAPVEATVFFRIWNPALAMYNIADVFAGISEKMDGAVRAFLGQFTIDQATTTKVQYKLGPILNGAQVDAAGDPVDRNDYDTSPLFKPGDSDFDPRATPMHIWKQMHFDWGVDVLSVAVSDIVLSEEVMKLRTEIMRAEKAAVAAVNWAKAEIERSKGQKTALSNIGKGLDAQIKLIAKTNNLQPAEVLRFLEQRMRWEAMSSSGAGQGGQENPMKIIGQLAAGLRAGWDKQ